jgi:hypothetical protein
MCAKPYPTQEPREEIGRQLHQSLNWQDIIKQANHHGVSQRLYHNLQKLDGAGPPEEILTVLRGRFDRAIRRNLFLTGELIRLISRLAEEGITAVPFKGPVLAEKLYDNLALRVFGDLDILVHIEEAEQAAALLIGDGYQHQDHPANAQQFTKAGANIILEVHWEVISLGSGWLRKLKNKPLPATLSHLSPRLQETKLGGKAVASLSPEDTLLMLTIHGSKHWWSRLNWLADIAALIHVYPDLDWPWIIEQTNQWQIRRLVFLGLYLAHELLAVKLPELVQEQITAEPALKQLSNLAQSMIFVEQNFETRYIKRPAYFRQMWDTRAERRMLYVDHLALYLELFIDLFK